MCELIILTARGTQAYFFDFGHVTFLRGQLPFMVIGQISPPFLDKIPPNLVCDQIILTARGTQAYFFDLGHVTFFRGQLPYMVIGPLSLELKKIMK